MELVEQTHFKELSLLISHNDDQNICRIEKRYTDHFSGILKDNIHELTGGFYDLLRSQNRFC